MPAWADLKAAARKIDGGGGSSKGTAAERAQHPHTHRTRRHHDAHRRLCTRRADVSTKDSSTPERRPVYSCMHWL